VAAADSTALMDTANAALLLGPAVCDLLLSEPLCLYNLSACVEQVQGVLDTQFTVAVVFACCALAACSVAECAEGGGVSVCLHV